MFGMQTLPTMITTGRRRWRIVMSTYLTDKSVVVMGKTLHELNIQYAAYNIQQKNTAYCLLHVAY